MTPHPSHAHRPVVLCILDGVGWGRRDEGDAFQRAPTPALDRLMAQRPWCLLKAHGTAVGMPSDKDMGNSEVGHNAMGAGRVFDQGAKLVDGAIDSGRIWRSTPWTTAMRRCAAGGTLHLIGLTSDGNVHSNITHLRAMIDRAREQGVAHLRVHVLTDGRDVPQRSALQWIDELERTLADSGLDYAIATGGGRMRITMDRYEADWAMVERGWRCHVQGQGIRFASAGEAIRSLYADDPDVDDQWLPAFVIGDYQGMKDGDTVLFFNFRGDRGVEISRAFDMGPEFDTTPGDRFFNRGHKPELFYAGMMQYDGDLHIPAHYLVEPPAIDHTVGQAMAERGLRVLSIAETQKFGHVTYFFNGNRSGALPGEVQEEVPSDNIPFDQAPAMKAREVTDRVVQALGQGGFDHIRLNLANGDMVGHTGDLQAAEQALAVVDECVGRLVTAAHEAGAVLLITADHGNADEMYLLDKKGGGYTRDAQGVPLPSTAHSLNPVPFVLVDPLGRWDLVQSQGQPAGGIAQIGATLLDLTGVPVPEGYLPSLVKRR